MQLVGGNWRVGFLMQTSGAKRHIAAWLVNEHCAGMMLSVTAVGGVCV